MGADPKIQGSLDEAPKGQGGILGNVGVGMSSGGI